MKSREIKELKNKPVLELEKMIREMQIRLRDLRLDLIAGKVKNVGELRTVRKDIARLNTFLGAAQNSAK